MKNCTFAEVKLPVKEYIPLAEMTL